MERQICTASDVIMAEILRIHVAFSAEPSARTFCYTVRARVQCLLRVLGARGARGGARRESDGDAGGLSAFGAIGLGPTHGRHGVG